MLIYVRFITRIATGARLLTYATPAFQSLRSRPKKLGEKRSLKMGAEEKLCVR
jgi:hypothetical protein